ncbi:hypothetical protein K502DRAFT_349572 [Neoconidiobolus thromboides FSU 785]|nr:hypothetical protein K502DRAFT_349572 [Neoconidiobolus thromboides FSU 785]
MKASLIYTLALLGYTLGAPTSENSSSSIHNSTNTSINGKGFHYDGGYDGEKDGRFSPGNYEGTYKPQIQARRFIQQQQEQQQQLWGGGQQQQQQQSGDGQQQQQQQQSGWWCISLFALSSGASTDEQAYIDTQENTNTSEKVKFFFTEVPMVVAGVLMEALAQVLMEIITQVSIAIRIGALIGGGQSQTHRCKPHGLKLQKPSRAHNVGNHGQIFSSPNSYEDNDQPEEPYPQQSHTKPLHQPS